MVFSSFLDFLVLMPDVAATDPSTLERCRRPAEVVDRSCRRFECGCDWCFDAAVRIAGFLEKILGYSSAIAVSEPSSS